MATAQGDTMVLVTIETKAFIKKIASQDGRLMKVLIDKAVREYATKHGLSDD